MMITKLEIMCVDADRCGYMHASELMRPMIIKVQKIESDHWLDQPNRSNSMERTPDSIFTLHALSLINNFLRVSTVADL
jgi:hypothetical protein